MADATATYAIDLEDGTSSVAESAAGALKKLRDQIDGDTKALAAMQRAMKNLQGGTSVNVEQFRALKAQIDAKKQSIAQAQSAYLSLGGSMGKIPGGQTSSLFKRLQEAAKATPGPLGGVVSKLGGLKAMLAGGAMALGLVALAAAVVAVTVASLAGTVALAQYGIAQADARRSELLRLEGLTKLRFWYQAAAGSATELQSSIDKVSAGVSLGRDQVGRYTEQLYKMGLRGANLEAALEGVAIKAAVQGDAAASAFAGMAAGAALTGHSVRKLADDVKARLGGIAARQMLSLDVQARKMRESFAALFSGLKIEGLLTAVKSVTDLFSQSTASGRALKAILEVMFGPIISGVETVAPLVKRFFQGLVIGALNVTIALLQVRNWFRRTFADSEMLSGLDFTRLAVLAGEVAVYALGAAFVIAGALITGVLVALTPILWGAVVAVGALALKGLLLAAPFLLGAAAIGLLIATGYQLYRLWKEIDWKSLGTAIVDGIVNGLKSGARWVKNAVMDLGKSVMTTFKDTLGIASPSKVFTKFGRAIPEGVHAGVTKGAPQAKRSVSDLINVPPLPSTSTAAESDGASPSASVRSIASVSIGELHVHSGGGQSDAKQLAADVKRELERILETVAIQMGAA